MDLKDLSLVLRRHWLAAVLAFVVVYGIGAATALTADAPYTASAVVAVQPRAAVEASGNPIQVANFAIPTYIARVGSGSFYGEVREALPAAVAGADVRVSASNDVGTGLIRVRATSADREAAVVWANALAERLVAVENEAAEVLELEVLDAARSPRAPESRTTALLVGSLVLAVMAALLSAIAASRVTRALDAAAELRRRLDVPILGEIPKIRGLRRSGKPLDVFLEDSGRDVLEAFQTLRTNVELSIGGERPTVLGLTSFSPGEGKSTVAAALATSLASLKHDVTLIDADLRQPTLHLRLGEPFGDGLADVGADPKRLVRRLRSGVRFLPAGVPDRHPADVVAVALPRALAALRGEGSLVVVDGPPLQGVAETPFIASVVDHLLIVVDPANGHAPELEQAVDRLRDAGVSVLGLVVNRTRRRRAAQMNPYYAYGLKGDADRPSSHEKAVSLITEGRQQGGARRARRV